MRFVYELFRVAVRTDINLVSFPIKLGVSHSHPMVRFSLCLPANTIENLVIVLTCTELYLTVDGETSTLSSMVQLVHTGSTRFSFQIFPDP